MTIDQAQLAVSDGPYLGNPHAKIPDFRGILGERSDGQETADEPGQKDDRPL